MGTIKRQGILSSIFMYAGIVIGFVNVTILFPTVLSAAEFGFTRWLLIVGSSLGLLAQLGMPSITYKFFPYFKDETKQHNGFLAVALLLPILGICLALLATIFFQEFIIQKYSDPISLEIVREYYWLLGPLVFFVVYYNILTAYSTSLFKASIPIFFRDVFVRLSVTCILLLHGVSLINYEWFVYLFTLIYGLQSVCLLAYLWWFNNLSLKWNLGVFRSMFKEILDYGAYALFAGGASYLVANIDGLMVSLLGEDQLADLGIYTVFFFVGTVILVPARAITSISLPVVAKAWKEKDLETIGSIYSKTALIQLVVGLGLFILLWANIDNFVDFLAFFKGDNQYAAGKYVALFVGLAKLIDGATGINGGIIITSDKYRFDLLFVILLIGLSIVSNYLFIVTFGLGMTGAAVATALTALIYNFGKFLFVKIQFGLQPFGTTSIKAILLGLLVLGINYLAPTGHLHFMIDGILRVAILGGLYLTGIYFWNVSPDVNRTIEQIWGKIKRVV